MTIFLSIVITTLVAFPLGVVTSKWVLLEGESIKTHVSNEIEQLRRDLFAAGKKL